MLMLVALSLATVLSSRLADRGAPSILSSERADDIHWLDLDGNEMRATWFGTNECNRTACAPRVSRS